MPSLYQIKLKLIRKLKTYLYYILIHGYQIGALLLSIAIGSLIFYLSFKLMHSYITGIVFAIATAVLFLYVLFTLNPFHEKLENAKKELLFVKRGISAEKAAYEYLTEVAHRYNLKLIKNYVVNTGKYKFDIDFILYDKDKKLLFVFECKSFPNAYIYEDGTLVVQYRGFEKEYNPKKQVLNNALYLKRNEFRDYSIIPIVFLPLATYVVLDFENQNDDYEVFYLHRDSSRKFEEYLDKIFL